MTTLKCSVTSCSSNSQHLCCRPEIHVGGKNAVSPQDTTCQSFTKTPAGATNAVGYENPNTSMPISCDATHCKYNVEHICDSDQIQVRGIGASASAQTECATFEARKQ